jgi:hypothetical protein
MSQWEIDRELVELREQLSYIRKLLQKRIEENQRQGWNPKKRVKWPLMQLFARKLRISLRGLKHRLSDWMKKDKIRGLISGKGHLQRKEFTYVNQSKDYSLMRMMRK